MIEVEIKLPVQDLEKIRKKLLESGFREKSLIEERDQYFDNAQGDIRAGQEALRVRETRDCLTGDSSRSASVCLGTTWNTTESFFSFLALSTAVTRIL